MLGWKWLEAGTNATAGSAITEAEGQSAWADPAHDARGNMTTIPKPAAMTGTYTCTYDAWNRLVKVETDDETPVTIARYEYGPPSRRRLRRADGLGWRGR